LPPADSLRTVAVHTKVVTAPHTGDISVYAVRVTG